MTKLSPIVFSELLPTKVSLLYMFKDHVWTMYHPRLFVTFVKMKIGNNELSEFSIKETHKREGGTLRGIRTTKSPNGSRKRERLHVLHFTHI